MSGHPSDPDDLPKQHPVTRFCCASGYSAVGLGAAILLLVVGIGVRLSFGPISLGPSAGALSGALRQALPPGIVMKYDHAAIEWQHEEGRIRLIVLGTEVDDADGTTVVRAPKAEIAVAAWPLLQGRIEVQRIALVGVQVTLVHGADGDYRLGLGDKPADQNLLKQILDRAAQAKGPSTLKSFSMRRADLTFVDEATATTVKSSNADIRLTRGPHGERTLDVGADVHAFGGTGRLDGTILLPVGDGLASGRLNFDKVVLATSDVGRKKGDGPLTAQARIVFAEHIGAGGARSLTAEIAASAGGTVRLSAVGADVRVRRIEVRAHFDGANQALTVHKACIDADTLQGCLLGRMQIETDKNGKQTQARIELTLRDIVVGIPQVFAGTAAFRSGAFAGTWDETTRRLGVETLSLESDTFRLQASGALDLPRGGGVGVTATGTLARLSVRDLVRYWPVKVAPGARHWVDKNMPAGMVGPLSFAVAVPVGGLDLHHPDKNAIAVTFPISDAEADYATGLTHMTHASGIAKLSATDFAIDVQTAKVGTLTIKSARFYIPDINAAVPNGAIDVKLAGATNEVLKQIDKKPLGYPTRFGLDPNAASGTLTADLHLSLPLSETVTFDQIAVSVRAQPRNLTLSLGGSLRLTDGNLVLNVDNKNLHAVGTVGIGGSASRLNVDWTEDFNRSKAVTTQIAVRGTLDATAREGLGLYADDYFRGPVAVNGTLSGHAGNLRQGAFAVDMTPAAVAVRYTAVAKPSGFPLSGRLNLTFAGRSRLTTANLHLIGTGSEILANAFFGEDGAMRALQVPTLRFGANNDFALNMVSSKLGTDMSLHAASFDGTRLMQDLGGASKPAKAGNGPDGAAAKPFFLAASIDRLVLKSSSTASNVHLEVGTVGERLTGFKLKATLGKTGSINGTMTQNEAGRALHLSAKDTGAFLRAFYGFASIRGGTAEFAAALPPAGSTVHGIPDVKGTLTIKDFRIVDQPFLTRLFSAGSLSGLGDLMQDQGIVVDTLEVPYVIRNRVVDIRDARATGPAVGLSADGYFDLPQNRVGLKGTLVPLYTLNSVLGNIPVLGDVLTSKTGEGIIGMSYSVKGNLDEPTIGINPLSVLTPGIFRRLVEGRIPKAPQTSDGAAPQKSDGAAPQK